MRKWNGILNGILGAFVGVFLGHSLYVVWSVRTRPGLYAMQSAPWYTSILLYGGVTLVVVLVCLAVKGFLKRRGTGTQT
ncbi:MAG TPA: hypothetical protein H9844_07395 [Candidatus Evtepia faecigallinarum]|nr:hypothetical protein [Candidatus Evtepia faecigallinarum]